MVGRTADVVVVGAGPAGCTAARELAGLGYRVVALEAKRFPRVKPCAGGVSMRGLSLLPPGLRELVRCEVRVAEIRHAAGVTVVEAARPVGGLVDRRVFDAEHARLAAAAGVEILEGCPAQRIEHDRDGVRVETPRGWVRGAAAVGADGAAGLSHRLAGRVRPRWAAAYEATAGPADRPGRVVFDFTTVGRGYAWSFPRPDGTSLGVYAWPGVRGVREAARRFVAATGASPRAWRGSPVPAGGLAARMAVGRLVLSGDAAGAVDPVTGEGIAHALETGELAARAVHRLLAEGVPLEVSMRALARLRRELRIARYLGRWLYAAPARRARILLGNPAIVRWVTRVVRGERGYLWLVGRALARWPEVVRSRSRRTARVVEDEGEDVG